MFLNSDGKPETSKKGKVISINASDKNIEVAFKTNDVFSSHNDNDDVANGLLMPPNIETSPSRIGVRNE